MQDSNVERITVQSQCSTRSRRGSNLEAEHSRHTLAGYENLTCLQHISNRVAITFQQYIPGRCLVIRPRFRKLQP
jgi:hypothetical protein